MEHENIRRDVLFIGLLHFLFFHSSSSDACSFRLVFHLYLFVILYPLNTEQGTNNEAIWERHKINEMVCVFNLHSFL